MKNLWNDHGTKILGALTVILAAFEALSPEARVEIFGASAGAVAALVTGVLTVVRGFTNSRVNNL